MSRLRSFTGLNWVGGELGEVIRKARDALEEYVEGGGEPAVLGPCVAHLNQVRGVLEMLQLRGVGRLAEEMHTSAQALMESRVDSIAEVAESLMLSLIQLPDYLEKLEAGGDDLPLILLPAVNDLRASRGVSALSETELLLTGEERPAAELEGEETSAWHLLRATRAARPLLHKGLLKWFRGSEPEDGLKNLSEVFSALEQNAESEPLMRGIFRAAHGVIEGLLDKSIAPDNDVKALVGRVDRVIKQIGLNGVAAADDAILQGVFKDLLYKISWTASDHPLIQAIKTEYDLTHAFPSEEELTEARQRMFAPSEDALAGIRAAAVKELMPIKDTLDLYIRGGRQHANRLQGLDGLMLRLANTLDMAGLNNLSSRLRDGAANIRTVASGEDSGEDISLMRVAGDLLFVESSLDNAFGDSREREGTEVVPETAGTRVPAGEMRSLISRTLQEAAVDMAKAKEAIVDYIGSPSNVRTLESTPKLFHGIAGALRVISRTEAADILDQIRDVIQEILLKSSVLPDQAVLDALADGITCIEYYMEAVAEERADVADILVIAQSAFQRLADSLETETTAESTPKLPSVETEIEEIPEIEKEIEEVSEIESTTPIATSEQTPNEFQPAMPSAAVSEDIDPEILEIFLEEAREEEPVIQETYARWRHDPADSEALATLRRSFHTLKGSGRLVGAAVIGEFAWSVENLLNRIIDQTLDVSREVTDFLDQAVKVVPELVNAQEANRIPDVDTETFMERAKTLAETRLTLVGVPSEPGDETIGTGTSGEELAHSGSAQAKEEFLTVEDSELREIFETEAREHLDFLNGFVSDCAQQTSPCGFDDELIRSLHTLAGSARMTGLDPIAVVAKALELKAVALSDKQLGADSVFIELLHAGSAAMAAMVAVLNEPEEAAAPVDHGELVARIEAYEPGAAAATVSLPETEAGFAEQLEEAPIGVAELAEDVSTPSGAEVSEEGIALEALDAPIFISEVTGELPVQGLDRPTPPPAEADKKEVELEASEPELVAATAGVEEEITLECLEQDLAAVAEQAEEGIPLEELEQPASVTEPKDKELQPQGLEEAVLPVESEDEAALETEEESEPPVEAVLVESEDEAALETEEDSEPPVEAMLVESDDEAALETEEESEPPVEAVDQETTGEEEPPVPDVVVPDAEPSGERFEEAGAAGEIVSADPELVEIFLELSGRGAGPGRRAGWRPPRLAVRAR
jgi:chemosensory pili system protein ChpA (sensor histidine kinase/response regulator)